MKVSRYAKAVVAAAGPVLYAAQAAVTDGRVDGQEWLTIGLAVLVAAGVWKVPNRPAR